MPLFFVDSIIHSLSSNEDKAFFASTSIVLGCGNKLVLTISYINYHNFRDFEFFSE